MSPLSLLPLILPPHNLTPFQIHGLSFFTYYCDTYMYLNLSIQHTQFIQHYLYVFRDDLLQLDNCSTNNRNPEKDIGDQTDDQKCH